MIARELGDGVKVGFVGALGEASLLHGFDHLLTSGVIVGSPQLIDPNGSLRSFQRHVRQGKSTKGWLPRSGLVQRSGCAAPAAVITGNGPLSHGVRTNQWLGIVFPMRRE